MYRLQNRPSERPFPSLESLKVLQGENGVAKALVAALVAALARLHEGREKAAGICLYASCPQDPSLRQS